ncbi:camphor resistance protein CrcB [Staphylococcus warneri]|nr:camphor resistance protein CrcB [Staphylococcus warneri]PTI22007.1 camphor resistance protein CrcB [Staphylococcus warneri]RIM98394.1 CrcB family protein [Staphylococcus warneri]RIN03871.1 CrcB family protein [Staphylococcus warneri]
MIMTMVLVMLGGGIGAMSRALISNYFNHFNTRLPVGTLIVNIVGCMLIGAISGLSLHIKWMNPFFITGILGGLTTFSTLSNKLVGMVSPQFKPIPFIIYTLLQFVGAFASCYFAYHLFQ